MGELWRSKEMSLVEVFIPLDIARDTVKELGEKSIIQFKDLNQHESAIHRNFSGEVKRADDLHRRISFFESQLSNYNKNIGNIDDYIEITNVPDENIDSIQLEDIEDEIINFENELSETIQNLELNDINRSSIIESIHVLENDDQFFTESHFSHDDKHLAESEHLLIDEEFGDSTYKIGFVTGVINRDKFGMFERVLFRMTRGNLYIRYVEIEEPIRDAKAGVPVLKNVFIIFFQGNEIGKKILKLCETYGTIYNCPEDRHERIELLNRSKNTLEDLDTVINRTLNRQRHILLKIAEKLDLWKKFVMREKAIFHTMNLFKYDRGDKCLIAEGWIPSEKLEEFQVTLRKGSNSHISSHFIVKETDETPPTYFPVNKFTSVYQDIINAYGVPRYREINPAAFTIVTFPFMFGVMFGDLGHGIILLIATIFLITKEKQWKGKALNDLISPAFEGRYVLLLMSLFSIYCGLIYNEVFSVPMNLFGTNWEIVDGRREYQLKSHNRTYPFGVDPVWKGAGNELLFYNSFKMKMSIIMGVLHMLLGMILKFINSVYTRNDLDIFFECIPSTVLMMSLFGYMCFLMFYKWNIPYYYNELNGLSPVRSEAPQILSVMIYMFLKPFENPPNMTPLFPSQGIIQGILVILAVLSIPVMLLPKPFILRKRWRERLESGNVKDDEEFEFSEVMVHQAIETIEFALGSISSTASYLRLWALSLAHSELSTVFWNLGLVQLGLGVGPFIVTFIVFAVWVGVTIGIILVMETLSAFLHSLRLHWVEFQGRFYKADGYLFTPLSFDNLTQQKEDE